MFGNRRRLDHDARFVELINSHVRDMGGLQGGTITTAVLKAGAIKAGALAPAWLRPPTDLWAIDDAGGGA